jgi:tetratricopeptide (TPR) repeat protein
LAELETISRLDPDSAEAQCEYAKTYVKTSQGAEKAIELFERAIKLKPDYAEAYNGLGWAYLDTWGIRAALRPPSRKNCTVAIEFFEKAVSLNPAYFDSYLGLGFCYNRLGRNKDALPYLEKAVQLNPDDGNAWTYLRLVYEELNRYEEAIEAQKRDIQIGSDDEMTMEKLYARNIPGRGKDRYLDMLDLARLYEKNGQIDEAVTCYEQAKTLEPFDPIAYHHLALALFAAGQREAAFFQYNLLLSLCQNTDDQEVCQHYADDLTHRLQW